MTQKQELAVAEVKGCNRCQQTFPLTSEFFYKDKSHHKKFRSACIPCEKQRKKDLRKARHEKHLQYGKTYYERNREVISEKRKVHYKKNIKIFRRRRRACFLANTEAVRERQRVWYAADPRRQLLGGAKYRADKAGLPFDLTLDDIEIPEFCPLLGIAIKAARGEKGFNPTAPQSIASFPHWGT